jgi:hypothetical protein
MWRVVLLPAVPLFLTAVGGGQDKGGVDPKVIAAWEKAGAEFGWMKAEKGGPPQFSPQRPAAGRAVPAFRIDPGKQVMLRDLPAPDVPFGLELNDLALTDADVKALGGFAKLDTLDLLGTKIGDAGLRQLTGLRQLQVLCLDEAKITDDGMKALAGLTMLRTLTLFQTKIGDDSMKVLGELRQLQHLDLGDTKITDRGLKELTMLRRLETLQLDGTKVTDAGVAELQKALPKCKIDR